MGCSISNSKNSHTIQPKMKQKEQNELNDLNNSPKLENESNKNIKENEDKKNIELADESKKYDNESKENYGSNRFISTDHNSSNISHHRDYRPTPMFIKQSGAFKLENSLSTRKEGKKSTGPTYNNSQEHYISLTSGQGGNEGLDLSQTNSKLGCQSFNQNKEIRKITKKKSLYDYRQNFNKSSKNHKDINCDNLNNLDLENLDYSLIEKKDENEEENFSKNSSNLKKRNFNKRQTESLIKGNLWEISEEMEGEYSSSYIKVNNSKFEEPNKAEKKNFKTSNFQNVSYSQFLNEALSPIKFEKSRMLSRACSGEDELFKKLDNLKLEKKFYSNNEILPKFNMLKDQEKDQQGYNQEPKKDYIIDEPLQNKKPIPNQEPKKDYLIDEPPCEKKIVENENNKTPGDKKFKIDLKEAKPEINNKDKKDRRKGSLRPLDSISSDALNDISLNSNHTSESISSITNSSIKLGKLNDKQTPEEKVDVSRSFDSQMKGSIDKNIEEGKEENIRTKQKKKSKELEKKFQKSLNNREQLMRLRSSPNLAGRSHRFKVLPRGELNKRKQKFSTENHSNGFNRKFEKRQSKVIRASKSSQEFKFVYGYNLLEKIKKK